jgi:hypothetical protein
MQQISQILPLVISKPTEIQVRRESAPLKTSEEKNFETAVLSKPKIFQLKQIEDVVEGFSQVEEVSKALRYIFVLIGLRAEQVPDEEEKAVLKDYVIEEYGGHTTEEIKLAFKMAIQGKLKIAQKDVKCYGIFSPAYFTSIMDAYREWATEQAEKLINRKEPERVVTEKEKAIINLEYAGWLQTLIKNALLPPLKYG